MRKFIVLFALLFSISAPAPALAQTPVPDLGRLSPPVRIPPRPNVDSGFCHDLDRYLAAHPDAHLEVRAPERTEVLNLSDSLHLQAVRHWLLQRRVNEARSAGRSLNVAMMHAEIIALSRQGLLDAVRLSLAGVAIPSLPIRITWQLRFTRSTWCLAAQAGRVPEPARAVAGSLDARFCFMPAPAGQRDDPFACQSAPGHSYPRQPVAVDAEMVTHPEVNLHLGTEMYGEAFDGGQFRMGSTGWNGGFETSIYLDAFGTVHEPPLLGVPEASTSRRGRGRVSRP